MMNLNCNNIFTQLPEQIPEEIFETLLSRDNIRIERIVSKGHTTEAGTWYDQEWDEWVLLMQGEAILLFADHRQLHLKTGDYVLIPAHVKHRVQWTVPNLETIWLAIHIGKPVTIAGTRQR